MGHALFRLTIGAGQILMSLGSSPKRTHPLPSYLLTPTSHASHYNHPKVKEDKSNTPEATVHVACESNMCVCMCPGPTFLCIYFGLNSAVRSHAQ